MALFSVFHGRKKRGFGPGGKSDRKRRVENRLAQFCRSITIKIPQPPTWATAREKSALVFSLGRLPPVALSPGFVRQLVPRVAHRAWITSSPLTVLNCNQAHLPWRSWCHWQAWEPPDLITAPQTVASLSKLSRVSGVWCLALSCWTSSMCPDGVNGRCNVWL